MCWSNSSSACQCYLELVPWPGNGLGKMIRKMILHQPTQGDSLAVVVGERKKMLAPQLRLYRRPARPLSLAVSFLSRQRMPSESF